MINKVFILILFSIGLFCETKAEIKVFEIKPVSSITSCDGAISVMIDGNSGPYDIRASINGTLLNTTFSGVKNGLFIFKNLCKGNYEIVVKDKNSSINNGAVCEKKLYATIVSCTPFDIIIQDKSPLVCDGINDGFINMQPQGGAAPYKYIWSNGKTTQSVYDLIGNKAYTVTVTDNNGCSTVKKDIFIDGQKVDFILKTVGSNWTNCQGTAKVDLISSIGSVISSDYTIGWTSNITSYNGNTASKLCPGKYTVQVVSEEGCKTNREFEVVSCSPKPLSIFSVNTEQVPIGQKAVKDVHENTQYCNNDSKIHIQIEGGTPPISYLLKRPDGTMLQSGEFDVTQRYVGNYWKNIPLKLDKNIQKGNYVFEAVDACGQKQNVIFDCTCNNLHFVNLFFDYDLCKKSSETDIKIKDNYSNPFGGFGFTYPTCKFDITWCENNPTSTTTVKISGYNGSQGKLEILSGKDQFKNNLDICQLKIINQFGCKTEYCLDFESNRGNTYNKYCFPTLRKLQAFNPNTNLKPPFSDNIVITNQFAIYNEDCQNKCKMRYEDPILEKVNINSNYSYVEASYIPFDYKNPCYGGNLKYPCLNNLKYFEEISITPIEWMEDINIKSIRPATNPLYLGLCEADVYCYFPVGGIYENYYPNYPKYFKTNKILDASFTCSTPDPPLPTNWTPISWGSTSGGGTGGGTNNCAVPLTKQSKGDCLYDIICPTTGDIIKENYYIPKYCILGVFDKRKCRDYDDLCLSDCDIEGFLRYDIVEYCHISDLCGGGIDFNNITVQSNISPVGGSYPPKAGDSYLISYPYYNKYSQQKETIKACFQGAFRPPPPPPEPEFSNVVYESKVIKVKNKNIEAAIYPNPFNNQLNIKLNIDKQSNLRLNLVDILGHIVHTEQIDVVTGRNEFAIELAKNLPQGLYYLQILGDDYQLQYPLVHL